MQYAYIASRVADDGVEHIIWSFHIDRLTAIPAYDQHVGAFVARRVDDAIRHRCYDAHEHTVGHEPTHFLTNRI